MASMKPIRMKDVPTKIWNDTYEKWRDVYENGWDDNLWKGCGLCVWMNQTDYVCSLCPLSIDKWCRNRGMESRLHPDYMNYKSNEEWVSGIKDFLIFLKPYCSDKE